jgi:hypothetical protein
MPACISKRVIAAAATWLMVLPTPAFACPVCGLAGTSDNAWAYTVMSAMLMVLPLGMIGGTVFWVARRSARHNTDVPMSPAAGPGPAPGLGRPGPPESSSPGN